MNECLFAGAARVCIDPPGDMFPLPQREMKYYNRTGEPMFLRAVALSHQGQRLLLLSYELFGTPFEEQLRQEVAGRLGLPPGNILICDTYNHCAPREDLYRFNTSPCGEGAQARTDAYFNHCVRLGAEAAQAAFEDLRPVQAFYGETDCPVRINRDQLLPTGWVLGKNPSGPGDPRLKVLHLSDRATGQPVAALLNYALYGNLAYLCGLEGEMSLPTGGDLPGRVCGILEEHLEAPVLWLCAAAGDQDPLMLGAMPAWHRDGSRTLRQMTLPEVAVIKEYQAQWIAGCARQAMGEKRILEGFSLDCRSIFTALPRRDQGGVGARAWVARLGPLWLLAVSGAPVARLGEGLLACLPGKEKWLITHAGCFTGYLVDAPHCGQETFAAVQMVAAAGSYEQAVLPLIGAALQDMSYNKESE